MSREKVKFSIKGNPVEGIEDWEGITLKANFNSLSQGGTVTSDAFLLVRDARDVVWNDVQNGNIFVGRDFQIRIDDRFNNSLTAFNGLISEQLEFINENQKGKPTKISARIQKNNSIEELRTLLDGTTYGFLESEGFITSSNGQFVNVITIDPEAESKLFAISLLATLTAIQIGQSIKDFAKDSATAIGIASGSLTGTVGAAVFAGLSALANAAFAAILLNAFLQIGNEAFQLLYPKLRRQKALSIKELLEIPLNKFGYNLTTNITDMDLLRIIPSNPNGENDIDIGTPQTKDFGYFVGEFFDFVLDLFNAKATVINGNEVVIRNKQDPYWKKASVVKLKDVKPESFRYNTDELVANRVYAFDFDLSNEYSIADRKDAVYQVITAQDPSVDDSGKDLIKGLEETTWNYSLVSRKDGLNNLEQALKALGKTIDNAVNFFGGRSNLESRVKQRDGAIKVSQTITSKPSIAPIIGGKLPSNHKELLNAEVIEKKYHFGKSFVRNNFIGQKKVVNLINVPFTLNDFVKTLETGLIQTAQGAFVEVDEDEDGIEWEVATQTATITYREPFVYTNKLKEIEVKNA